MKKYIISATFLILSSAHAQEIKDLEEKILLQNKVKTYQNYKEEFVQYNNYLQQDKKNNYLNLAVKTPPFQPLFIKMKFK